MLYLPEFDTLFIHIHKNAGKGCKYMLKYAHRHNRPGAPDLEARVFDGVENIHGHAGISHIIGLAPKAEHCKLLSVCRNPWERLHSAFSWWKKKEPDRVGINQTHIAHIEDFEAFVDLVYKTYTAFERRGGENPFKTQTRGKVKPDRIIYPGQMAYFRHEGRILPCRFLRQENLNEEITSYLHELYGPDAQIDLAHVGATPRKDFRTVYSAEMRDRVAEIYADDIEHLGYRFDPPAQSASKE